MIKNNFLAPLLIDSGYQLSVIEETDSHFDIFNALLLKGYEVRDILELDGDYCLVELIYDNCVAVMELSTICKQEHIMINFGETEKVIGIKYKN